MRIALAQLNVVVGDLDGNVERIVGAIDEAARAVAPTSSCSRSLPSPAIRPRTSSSVRASSAPPARRSTRSRARAPSTVALVGCPAFDRDLANAAFVCADGEVRGVYRKHFLPNYGVFDEHRYFAPGRELRPARAGGRARRPDDLRGRLAARPARHRPRARRRDAARQPLGLAVPRRQGGGSRGDARHAGTGQRRLRRVLQPRRRPGRARLRRPLGRARRRGRGDRARARVRGGAARRRHRPDRGDRPPAPRRAPPRARARRAPRRPVATTIRLGAPRARRRARRRAGGRRRSQPELEQMRLGLGLGLRDYVRRTASATSWSRSPAGSTPRSRPRSPPTRSGAERVHTVSMPSRFSSEGTRDDAREVSENLGVDFREIPIEAVVGAFHEALGGLDGPRRGEPPGADPRHDADGALEHARLARRSRPATSRRWRSATRRSTATWSAATRCSRTSSRPTCSASRGT